jgi:hypothetical protein
VCLNKIRHDGVNRQLIWLVAEEDDERTARRYAQALRQFLTELGFAVPGAILQLGDGRWGGQQFIEL